MKYIGNIITDSKITDVNLYNVVKTKEQIIKELPTLIIGYKKVKSYYESFSLLDWKIEENIYWTYGRRERGDKYIERLEIFKNMCFQNMIKTIKYYLFNVLIEDEDNKKKFLNFLKNDVIKTVYIDNDMAYIYNDNKHVIGISLRDIDYNGGNRKKILSILLNKNKIINNKDIFNTEYINTLKTTPYIIPYLYS